MPRWVTRAAEYGYGAVALADVNSMTGVVDLCKAAQKTNVRPIVGVEILTTRESVILLAENQRGYENLCRITTARNLDASFDLVEQLGIDSRGMICICRQPALLSRLKKVLDKNALFVGCGDAKDVAMAQAKGVEAVVWNNANWLEKEDIEIAKVLGRIRQMRVIGPGPKDRYGFSSLVPVREIEKKFQGHKQVLANTEQLIERCNLELLRDRPILPKITLPKGMSSDRELAKKCHRGLAKRYHPVSKEVVKRLEYELTVVQQNGFSDYFLLVHEIVNFAKEKQIPVEVRGSAAGSLISYVLGFTRVCPVENNLYFERFMNPGRTDCPDIDIDLCWRKRDEVIRFCYDHWGHENVAMVCNVNRYRRRGAIRDAGRALGLGPTQINRLIRKGQIKEASAVYQLAERLIGIPRHLGVHCSGIVVAPRHVSHLAPLERASKGVIITQYDKDAAEAIGLVKIDLLGNRSLSTTNEAIEMVRRGHNGDLDFDAEDRKTAQMP